MNGSLYHFAAIRWWKPLQGMIDRWRFSGVRDDYYDFLACLLQGMQGSRTLKDIFELDARRYGSNSVRGRLSLSWAQAYRLAGGDLYATWLDSFPQPELALIRSAQLYGNVALVKTLGELAQALRLARETRSILGSTLWAAAAALSALCLMLMAIPWLTVPQLLKTFAMVPAHYHGQLTASLIRFAEVIQAHWLFMIVAAMGAWVLVVWSLPNACGRLRLRLDEHGVWRIYRYIHALRFLGMLAILLGRGENDTTQLRTALLAQRSGASVWLGAHLDAMLHRIDAGIAGPGTFDTGLFDRDQYWFLSDMIMSRGLRTGLALTAERVKTHVTQTVSRQALALRWCLLLASLSALIALAMWHYAVIDELRRSLMLFYASQ